MHFFLRKLIAGYPEKIRLVHKHFPMDKKFNPMLKEDLHPGSGILSSIAVYAARENKFWELNDYLYHYNMGGNAIYLRKIAQESGLDLDRLKTGIHDIETRQKLQEDIISGLKENIGGTPSYIINDKVYTGLIPSDVLNAVIK
jgi:protein-disulfide isomerase